MYYYFFFFFFSLDSFYFPLFSELAPLFSLSLCSPCLANILLMSVVVGLNELAANYFPKNSCQSLEPTLQPQYTARSAAQPHYQSTCLLSKVGIRGKHWPPRDYYSTESPREEQEKNKTNKKKKETFFLLFFSGTRLVT